MAHLSVVGETPDGLDAILDRLADAGIENILALRGDPPRGDSDFTPPPDGLRSSAELAAFIRGRESTSGFGIGASCHPEVHPEAPSPEADIALPPREGRRRRGVPDQPAVLRQRRLLRLGRARARGRHRRTDRPGRAADHLPRGSAPVLRRLRRKIPERLDEQLAALDGDPTPSGRFGIAYASRQCEQLLAAGAPGIHFFVLNRATSVKAILGAIKAGRPWERTGGEILAAARGTS